MNVEKFQKLSNLASELLSEVRAEALVSLRFLDVALYKLKFSFDLNTTIYTDANYLYANPYYIFGLYKEDDNILLRTYLHIVLHLIFFHLFINKSVDEKRWNLACDMSVENIINELKLPTLISDNENPQIPELNIYRQKVGDLTAEKLYNYFMVYGISDVEVERLNNIFERDNHSFWFLETGNVGTNDSDKKLDNEKYNKQEKDKDNEDSIDKKEHKEEHDEKDKDVNNNDDMVNLPEDDVEDENDDEENSNEASNVDGDKNKADTGETENPDADSTDKCDINDNSNNEQEKEGGENVERPVKSKNEDKKLDNEEAESLQDKINEKIGKDKKERFEDNSDNRTEKKPDKNFNAKRKLNANIENSNYNEWKNISERTKEDLLMFASEWGSKTNTLRQYIVDVNKKKYDYDSFLKKFAVIGENVELNDEEFDNIYYTYGLNMYKNVPLVEPLEYKEVNKIKEFIIAIDCSGSVKGELVQKFIEKTYNILTERQNFFTKVNIHILLCDTEIKKDYKITSMSDLNEFIKTIVFEGFGGTDFRPVFKYIDDKKEKGEFKDLKGLIYFTDGLGDFPIKNPSYDSAFVFIKSDYVNNGKKLHVPSWAIKIVLDDI